MPTTDLYLVKFSRLEARAKFLIEIWNETHRAWYFRGDPDLTNTYLDTDPGYIDCILKYYLRAPQNL